MEIIMKNPQNMKYIKELKIFEESGKHKFGCAMVYFDLPLMEALHRIIDETDIYTEEGSDRSYGLEDEPHTTLLYGLHADVDDAEVLRRSKPDEYGDLLLSNVSCFENEKYDVLKMDASADWLKECNARLAELPHTTDYPDYHPHATIGYLKKGTGKKYTDMLKGMEVRVAPGKIVYSKADGSKIEENCQ